MIDDKVVGRLIHGSGETRTEFFFMSVQLQLVRFVNIVHRNQIFQGRDVVIVVKALPS